MSEFQNNINKLVSFCKEVSSDKAICDDYVCNRAKFHCEDKGWHKLTFWDLAVAKLSKKVFFEYLSKNMSSYYSYIIESRKVVGINPPDQLTNAEIQNKEVFFFTQNPKDSLIWDKKDDVNIDKLDQTFWSNIKIGLREIYFQYIYEKKQWKKALISSAFRTKETQAKDMATLAIGDDKPNALEDTYVSTYDLDLRVIDYIANNQNVIPSIELLEKMLDDNFDNSKELIHPTFLLYVKKATKRKEFFVKYFVTHRVNFYKDHFNLEALLLAWIEEADFTSKHMENARALDFSRHNIQGLNDMIIKKFEHKHSYYTHTYTAGHIHVGVGG